MPLHLTKQASKVLEKRSLAKDDSGRVMETPEEMFDRVALSDVKESL